jgi:hypothetical protein
LEDFKTPLVSSFLDQLVIEALQVDILIGKPHIPLFIEYLKRPIDVNVLFKKEYRKKLQSRKNYSYDIFWHDVHGLEVSRGCNQAKLVEDYLRMIFRNKPDHKHVEQFYGYFEKSYLDALFCKVLLAMG